jgi:16S rRNA (guanine966-N2)-methyltransferase
VLRIVGGAWRSRRFRFPAGVEIRPTPDRVRETLFNWLAPAIDGARCLDLFAGSGALGLEALSRGAAEVVFVERNRIAAAGIRAVLAEWQAGTGRVFAMDALKYLSGAAPASLARAFDIVFLDPPFASGALPQALHALAAGDWIAPGGSVYVEFAARTEPLELPAGLTVLKEGRNGEVGYHLLRQSGESRAGQP